MAPTASRPVIPQNDSVAHALAGAGGGILAMILTYPLITLSTRAQVESRRADSTFLKAVRQITAREGIPGLYAGLDSALLGISVTNFVYYYWYEWTRAFFEAAAAKAGRASKKLTTAESIIAGAIAGSATVILTNPIWVINTRMTTRKHEADSKDSGALPGGGGGGGNGTGKRASSSPTTIGTLLALLRDEGPRALFAGVLPALVLVANPILQYTLFEQLKNALVERRRRPVTPGVAFLLGALGKLFATGITYPYITVKSQAHVAGGKDAAGAGSAGGGTGGSGKGAEGMAAAIRRIVRQEGYAGLYKGVGPKLTQSVLTAALLFAFKDVLYQQTVRLRRRALLGKAAA